MKTYVIYNEQSEQFLDCGLRLTAHPAEAKMFNSAAEAEQIFDSCLPDKVITQKGWKVIPVNFTPAQGVSLAR